MYSDSTGPLRVTVAEHPTNRDKNKIKALEAKMNSQYDEYHPGIAGLNYLLAYLQVTLVECPDWLKESDYGLDLQDEIPISAIDDKIKEFLNKRFEKEMEEVDEREQKGKIQSE
jgi:hypothetical protein